jgi:PAS domain S-box-containing protein
MREGENRDHERTEQALRRSEAYLAEGQRISQTGSWAWNAASGEVYWSAEHFRIFGLEPFAVAPTYPDVLHWIHPEDRGRLAVAFENAARDKAEYEIRCRVLRDDGDVRHVHIRGHPTLDEAGALMEYVGTIIDVTERRRAEEGVQKAREELAHVNRALTVAELTASIAHELNQPLAAVVANANACERWLAATPPNQAEAGAALRRIARDARRASEIIQRIRGLMARRASSRTELQIEGVVADVVALAEERARAAGVALSTRLSELPAVYADRVQVEQVLLNLLMNAIDAMADWAGPRTIEVSASREGAAACIAVSDSGPGFDPRLKDRVFEAFFTTKPEGMGMGLAISRSIVEAHGGRIEAAGNERGGATFRFLLPVHT